MSSIRTRILSALIPLLLFVGALLASAAPALAAHSTNITSTTVQWRTVQASSTAPSR